MDWRAVARHRAVHSSLFLSLNQVVKFVSRGFYMLLLAKQLGPELYGILSYGQTWYLIFLTLSALGVSQATLHMIGRDAGDPLPVVRTSLALRLSLLSLGWPLCAGLALIMEPDGGAARILLVLSLAVIARQLWRAHASSSFPAPGGPKWSAPGEVVPSDRGVG